MSAELELELRSLEPGDHACVVFDGAGSADDWALIVSFFKEGFARGERCILIVDDAEHRKVAMQVLSESGVDAELETKRGALTFLELEAWLEEPFDPRVRLRAMELVIRQSLAQGFRGVRCCGMNPRFSSTRVDEGTWIEFESLVSEASRRWKAILLCRHDIKRNHPRFLREMLRVHPKAILGPLVCPCTFYEPASMVLGKVSDDERLRWMIDQLCNARLAQRALEHAVRARDEFLTAASHELRTPVASALLALEQVLRATKDNPDAVPGLRRLQSSMRRFVDVSQRLIDASQLRDEQVELHREPVDLTAATRSALDRCQEDLRRAHCDVHLALPDEAIVGQWDRMRIEQVVANLLENAARFGASRPIDVTVSRSDGWARLVVHDHGIGIGAEDAVRIFERFERGVPVTHYGGFGLGLWIVRTIVEAFGGHVSVESAPETGTAFAVELPLGS